MQEIKDRIYKDGVVIGENILKVDSFINHQIDTKLLDDIGAYLASKFEGATKILTIETSGIAFGITVANHLGFLPLVFAKKSSSKVLDKTNVYQTVVYSYTKETTNIVSVDKRFLSKDDKVLIIDDFLAEGNACLGLIDLCRQAGAEIVGIGIVIEKGFQHGRQKILEQGIKLESAVIVETFKNGKPILK